MKDSNIFNNYATNSIAPIRSPRPKNQSEPRASKKSTTDDMRTNKTKNGK